ncbi:DUF6318 family protein [Promicromonospora vindobonensis]|uniref:DUF6318 family protein n=1 Tax=Promicromonospora vindobonensis TaxID=195748 RepID=A0ABW5VSF7_9MICO
MGNAAIRMAGLVVAAGLALSACTGSTPEADADASPSGERASASPSASPSSSGPVKPERPDAMKRKDAKGAAAAAEYFIELYPYVMATGDTEEFEAMSHRACDYCRGTLENAAWLQKTRGSFEGGLTDAVLAKTYQRDELTGVTPFDFMTSQAEIWIRDEKRNQIDHVSTTEFEARVEVGRHDGAWVIVEVAPDPGSDQ